MKKKRNVMSILKLDTNEILLKMKLLTLLMFIAFVSASASSYSQATKFNLDMRNVSIGDVFQKIEEQSEFVILFNEKTLDINRKVNVIVKDKTVENILDQIFNGEKDAYKILDRQIAIYPDEIKELPSIIKSETNAEQRKELSGTVKDSKGLTLPGVSVVVKGTTIGTITDNDGKFRLSVPADAKTIVFSFVGMKSQEIAISGKTLLNVEMQEELVGIEEVVAIGYGTQRKKDLSGSVVSVKTEDVKSIPAATMDQALIGHAAGVQVVQNANPGSMGTIRIRGISTTGSNDPLWIIDGIPSSPNDLNPDDIESMDVLKDASAGAIYGSRAANGVIIVTTKRGKTGKTKVEFDTYIGYQSIWKKLDVLNAEEFATLANRAYMNAGLTPNPAWANPSSLSTTDWQDAVTRNGAIQNYNLSVSGGTEKLKAALSLGYNKTEGSIIVSNYERYTIRLNADYEVNKRLKFGSSFTFSRSSSTYVSTNDGSSGLLNNAVQMWPDQPVYNTDGTYNILLQSSDPMYYPRQFTNPVAQAHLSNNRSFGQRFISSLFGELEILNGLKFRTTLGIDAGNGSSRYFAPTYVTDPPNWLNRTQNSVNWNMSESQGYTWINTLTYANTFGVHNITALVGTEATRGSGYNVNTVTTNTPTNALSIPSAALTRDGTGSGYTYASLSYFGRINYIYNDKYILQFNVRADASDNFAPENRWGYFPSGSAAWRISKENFMQSLKFISDLKIRGSYGATGNSSVGSFPYLSTYSIPSFGYVLGTTQSIVSAYQLQNLANPDLKWETQKTTDVGIDVMLFNNTLSVTADYYNKRTDGLLAHIPVPSTIGAPGNTIAKNAGEIKNQGFEFAVNYNGKAGDFKYNLGANITTVKNKVLSLGGGDIISSVFLANDNYMQSRTAGGRSIGEFYGLITDGIYQNVGEIPASEIAKGLVPGDRRYKDISGPDGKPDGKIDDNDRTYLGSPIPKFFYGINLGGSFKGFDFSMVLQGQYGNKILNEMKAQLYPVRNFHGSGVNNALTAVLDSWNGEGTSNTIPRITYNFQGNNWLGSDFYVEDGSFLRCRTMQVGYTLPASIVNHVKLGSVRVYVNAQNLFTITKYSGFDPEISNSNPLSSGVDWGQYPVSRVYTVGINVQF